MCIMAVVSVLALPVTIFLAGREIRLVAERYFINMERTQVLGGQSAQLLRQQIDTSHELRLEQEHTKQEQLRLLEEQKQATARKILANA